MVKKIPSAFVLFILIFTNSCARVPSPAITGQVDLSSSSFIFSENRIEKTEQITNNVNSNTISTTSQINYDDKSKILSFAKKSNDIVTNDVQVTSGFTRIESNTVTSKVIKKNNDFSLSVKKNLGNLDTSNISDVEFANRIEDLIFQKTNTERVKRGLQPLKIDKNLAKIARIHNDNMQNKSFVSHTDQFGMEPADRKEMFYPNLLGSMGENIFYLKGVKGDDAIAEELLKGWMESEGHRENILSLDFTHIGIGVVVDDKKVYATQNFSDEQAILTTSIPNEVNHGEEVNLSFKFVGNFDKKRLSVFVEYPDKNEKFYVSEHQYYLGYGKYEPVWEGSDKFSLNLKFDKGKGLYKIRTGKDASFYEECINIQVN